MNKFAIKTATRGTRGAVNDRASLQAALAGLSLLACGLVTVSGCKTNANAPSDADLAPYTSPSLREGNNVVISFPGSPNLNTTVSIRSDGKIDLPLVGEVVAAGKTPSELEKEILKLYESQLVSKQVSVTVQSAAYAIYVTGSVVKPGKIMAERPLSVLDAIAEAGGFDNVKANMRSVVVIRHEEGGELKRFKLDLKKVLEKGSTESFYLRPSDIVYVPERLF